jgi:23S rRNA (cytosine1962-C5)-methyltransferase
MGNAKSAIAEAIQAIYSSRVQTIYYTNANRKTQQKEEYLLGKASGTWFKENGLYFYAQWEGGQKTGYFLDQRDNRKLLREYAGGRLILDAFSHAGGFGINAVKSGAKHVVILDVSEKVLKIAENNFEKNRLGNFTLHEGDTLDYLKKNDTSFDIIVLDPPAYAKHLSARHQAVQGYKRLNKFALRRIRPGGMLFTFSCSQVVDKVLFENTVRAAAIESGRNIRILHWLTQPPDHPVDIFHPEGGYLKGLVLAVD